MSVNNNLINTFDKVATHASVGTTYVRFPSYQCKYVVVWNMSGVTVEITYGGTGQSILLENKVGLTLRPRENSDEYYLRRQDTVATSVDVTLIMGR